VLTVAITNPNHQPTAQLPAASPLSIREEENIPPTPRFDINASVDSTPRLGEKPTPSHQFDINDSVDSMPRLGKKPTPLPQFDINASVDITPMQGEEHTPPPALISMPALISPHFEA